MTLLSAALLLLLTGIILRQDHRIDQLEDGKYGQEAREAEWHARFELVEDTEAQF